ncbi:hypothetical protein NPIL_293841 [Nephila pilipes]|uniref:Uncharacterized protein n=1 Tax=Nephila pilipes TaxID=299642 RepID=A0A8X6K2Z4_NEPPI|nr:hypothetical protein NPIL_293841 [Nephila pilipes]
MNNIFFFQERKEASSLRNEKCFSEWRFRESVLLGSMITHTFSQNKDYVDAVLRSFRQLMKIHRGPITHTILRDRMKRFERTGHLRILPGREQHAVDTACMEDMTGGRGSASSRSPHVVVSLLNDSGPQLFGKR